MKAIATIAVSPPARAALIRADGVEAAVTLLCSPLGMEDSSVAAAACDALAALMGSSEEPATVAAHAVCSPSALAAGRRGSMAAQLLARADARRRSIAHPIFTSGGFGGTAPHSAGLLRSESSNVAGGFPDDDNEEDQQNVSTATSAKGAAESALAARGRFCAMEGDIAVLVILEKHKSDKNTVRVRAHIPNPSSYC